MHRDLSVSYAQLNDYLASQKDVFADLGHSLWFHSATGISLHRPDAHASMEALLHKSPSLFFNSRSE